MATGKTCRDVAAQRIDLMQLPWERWRAWAGQPEQTLRAIRGKWDVGGGRVQYEGIDTSTAWGEDRRVWWQFSADVGRNAMVVIRKFVSAVLLASMAGQLAVMVLPHAHHATMPVADELVSCCDHQHSADQDQHRAPAAPHDPDQQCAVCRHLYLHAAQIEPPVHIAGGYLAAMAVVLPLDDAPSIQVGPQRCRAPPRTPEV